MKILVTGGAGYIGSHAIVALLEAAPSVSLVVRLAISPEFTSEWAA
ncbi:NAD-dependent epimerase/dehydratase family protein [Vreelandella subglaciescola]|uniref:NAD dependent epimerase/dehydratase family protein n=1 Tax=Vreelandella subglaciescola TaxID=29571 RepID=A0A1M7F9L1_9GAMM|nr:NAD-dependent epimerase/dehydratase family protein [Halomonas subglaciescola]SHM00357.1 NAD dependent epimerase/dehydratase family protein [Halomonas subglaciescola]